jgi:hypothetical protein
MLGGWLQRMKNLNPRKFDTASLLLMGLLVIFVSSVPFILKYLHDASADLIESRAVLRRDQFWDFMLFEDRPEECHLLRLQPEGMSVHIRDLESNVLLRGFDLFGLRDPEKPNRPIHFTSAGYSPPTDLNGDGSLEALVVGNDTASSYLIAYDAHDSARIIYRADWIAPIPDSLWQGYLEVRGATDFGKGLRLVLTLNTRYQGDPRRVIILDPQSGQIETSWAMGAPPSGRFGFLPGNNHKNTGFYLTTQATCNGNHLGDLSDSLGYLLTFIDTPDGWKMEVVYGDSIRHGCSVDARPVNLSSGPGWMISNSDTCFIQNERSERISNAFFGNTTTYLIEETSDRDGDGSTDLAIVTGMNRIYLLSIADNGSLKITAELPTSHPLISFFWQRVYPRKLGSSAANFLFYLTQDWVLHFLNNESQEISAIQVPEIGSQQFSSVTMHGRQRRTFLRTQGTSEGLFVYGGYGKLVVTRFSPALNKTTAGAYLLAGLYLMGTLLCGWSAWRLVRCCRQERRDYQDQLATLQNELAKVHQTHDDRTEVISLAAKAFRRKPSDVTLYMDQFVSGNWQSLIEKVKVRTAEELDNLNRPGPHDSIREEVSIPMRGEERLISLLTHRRIALHFITQGMTGNDLMKKLNFTLEEKYDRLIRDGKAILQAAKREVQPNQSFKLTPATLKPILAELEKARVISDGAIPRRLSGELTRDGSGVYHGSLKLSQGGKEIQLTIMDGIILHTFHTNLSPAFSEFLALIGLSAEALLNEQVLLPEEVEEFTTRQ